MGILILIILIPLIIICTFITKLYIRAIKYKWNKFKRLEEEEKERNKYWK